MDDYTHLRGVGGIYRIVHIASGRCYIGRSGDIAKRWDEHLRCLTADTDHHSAYLQHAWNKYGPDAFKFEVIVLEPDPHKRIILEQYYLDKRLFERGSKEYNMSSSSRGPVGVKHSAEVRARMGAARRGKKRSPESIEKMKRTAQSRPPTWKELAARELIKEANRKRLKGTTVPQSVREKIRAKLLGQPPSPAAQAANTARRGRPLNERQTAANTARRGRPLNEKERAYHDSQKGIVNEKLQARAWVGRQLGAKASAEARRGKPPPPNAEAELRKHSNEKKAKHRGKILDAMNHLGWGLVLPSHITHNAASKQIAAIHDMNPISVFNTLKRMLAEGTITRANPPPQPTLFQEEQP